MTFAAAHLVAEESRTVAAASSGGGAQRTWGYVVGATGIVAGGLAGYLFFFAVPGKVGKTDACAKDVLNCPDPDGDREKQAHALEQDERRYKNASAALGVGALVAVATGAVLLATAPGPRTGASRLRFGPRVIAGHVGVGAGGTW